MQVSRNVRLGDVLSFLIVPLVSLNLWAEDQWYRAPTLSIMTGFIKDPQKPGTIMEWQKDLGNRLDADKWVRDFKEAGATYLIFYDKWIDGLVFHDTKTTEYKTRRDFLREIADACHSGGLRLVIYFNAHIDGNPDFKKWAVRDLKGTPILFSKSWPFESQSLHSPFRGIAVEQARELLTNYGRIDGLWLDVFSQRLNTRNEWVTRGCEKMYGAPFREADPSRRNEFILRTLACYLDEVRAIADQHQKDCVLTTNGAAWSLTFGGSWAKWVGARLDYGSAEGHSFDRIDQIARIARVCPKPVEIGTLVNRTWFTPKEDKPPPAKSPSQVIAEVAVGVCQGASVYMALTPGHAGTFGDDLKAAKAAGAWFSKTEPLRRGARPYADAAILLGAPVSDGPGIPRANSLWKRYAATPAGALDEGVTIQKALERAGMFAELLCAWDGEGNWPESLSGYRAVFIPELAVLDDAHIGKLRQYVREGGRLVAFGHASLLDERGARRKSWPLTDVLGLRYKGDVGFPPDVFPTTVYVDSVYNGQFPGRNLIDDEKTFWASADTPMPHWAQVNLPVSMEAAKVELVSREGPYVVTDIDVEAYDGKTWNLVKSVRGAEARIISAQFDDPVQTKHIRVKILHELYQGEDRQIADVEAIRLFDTTGRNRATDEVRRFKLIEAKPEPTNSLKGKLPSFVAMAIEVEPTTAVVVARLNIESRAPAILRNRFGKGEAILFTTSEASFRHDAQFWSGLSRWVVGQPTLLCSEMERYRVILTRVGARHVLHVIDRNAGGANYEPAKVIISLSDERLGAPKDISFVGAETSLDVKREKGYITLTVRPNPVASVTLE